jgi:hypothetical protein
MGMTTPKTPFNLAEFLATPATIKVRKKPKWSRLSQPPEKEPEAEQE